MALPHEATAAHAGNAEATEAPVAAGPVAPRTPAAWRRYDNIALVIMFNKHYDGLAAVYETLREAYRPIFGTIIWTGLTARPIELPGSEAWVSCEGQGGSQYHMCLVNVIQEVRGVAAACPPPGR